MDARLQAAIAGIRPTDPALEAEAQRRLDSLTKPPGSLGRLEALARQIYRVQRSHVASTVAPLAVDPARVYTVAGDHGIAAAGVSPYPQEVTRQMVLNFVGGGAGVNVLCRTAGVDIRVVDAGSAGDDFPESPGLVRRKIAPGTANLLDEPAMTHEQCLSALNLGLDLAAEADAEGIRCVGLGEMGIGNTTPSTALYCAYLGLTPSEITGPGAGLLPEGVARKTALIARALARHRGVVAEGDALDILAALGGLEIATLAGLTLGAAQRGLIVVVDGFIATAAFVAAWKLAPAVLDYAVCSHASAEPGHRKILAALGCAPLLHLDMRLGEGTGAALAMFLLRAAVNIFNEMATFEEAGVSQAGG